MWSMIRALDATELDTVRDLREALHVHHDALPTPPGFRARPFEESWSAWRDAVGDAVAEGTGTVLVHTPPVGGVPDGMAYLRMLPPDRTGRPFLAPTGPHAELATLVVSAASRGEGVGSALTDACTVWAREHGAVAMHIGVRSTNLDARRLYLRRGAEAVFETLVQPL